MEKDENYNEKGLVFRGYSTDRIRVKGRAGRGLVATWIPAPHALRGEAGPYAVTSSSKHPKLCLQLQSRQSIYTFNSRSATIL